MMLGLQKIAEALEYAQAGQTIIDASNTARLAAYVVRNRKKVTRPVRALWRGMAEFMTPEEAKRAIRIGGLPIEWRKEWERVITAFVGGEIGRIQEAIFAEVGEEVARRINRLPQKEFVFGTTTQRILDVIKDHGAELVTNSTQAQIKAINVALMRYVQFEAMTPFELARRLRNYIGLTERYANAVVRLEQDLISQELGRDVIAKQVERYTDFLHKVRAENISRTELSFGYNHGQLEAIGQARDGGWFQGEVRKKWNTTGQSGRVCEECEELDGEEVGVDEDFSAGVAAPPLHPSCGCGLSYEVRR